ncbi:MAG: lasso peptide isopeptide bond-forming cyclase [Richelia sp. SL_2_1]|nr:lasso peptide isopeptide bond-forming cyclase [Richelia sp. SM1_7_0]NJO28733.1 lasso peptide isopeptide bond-forming cyclase [Richelia sp. SL_2_1]
MSGIVGIHYLDGRPVDRENLTKMVDILAHRGPDGADTWVDGCVGLGHRMLWTTPESLFEKLPYCNQRGDLVITADARIDNRDELIAALQINNRPADKIADSELILAAYEKWGEDCPEHLLGDFAFAIWDERRQILFCARDHFGVKPFYYYSSNNTFVFGSEIKAILCLPQIPRCLNEARIADFLYPVMENKSITSYKDIFRLPPGHSLIVSKQNSIRLHSYWSLEIGEELRLNSDEEYAEAFRDIFTQAVRCRVRSAFPVSSHLSGGLDSSAVSCVARDILREQGSHLHTFSNIFDDVPECDERSYIYPVLKQGGFIPHYVSADKLGPLSEWQHFFQYIDEAFIGPSHFLLWGLNRATQQAGMRISLDGFDGDTTVSHGSAYFAELARQGNWTTFIEEGKAVSKHFDTSLSAIFREYGISYLEELAKHGKWLDFAKVVHQISQHFQVFPKKLFVSHGLKPLLPESLLQFHKWLRGEKSQFRNTSLINSNFAQKNHLNRRIQAEKIPASVREDQWLSLTCALFTHTLELVDQSSAAFSIESRHPFMDKRLIEFCLSVPPEQKLHQGWSRMIMRRAMNGILPQEIQWRGGKTSMSPNFRRGLLHLDRKILDEVVINNPTDIQEIVALESLHKSYREFISDKQMAEDHLMPVWKSVTLALWLRQTEIKP